MGLMGQALSSRHSSLCDKQRLKRRGPSMASRIFLFPTLLSNMISKVNNISFSGNSQQLLIREQRAEGRGARDMAGRKPQDSSHKETGCEFRVARHPKKPLLDGAREGVKPRWGHVSLRGEGNVATFFKNLSFTQESDRYHRIQAHLPLWTGEFKEGRWDFEKAWLFLACTWHYLL